MLTNVEVHILPTSNHSYELAYTAKNPLGFSGVFVLEAGADATMTFSDPRGVSVISLRD